MARRSVDPLTADPLTADPPLTRRPELDATMHDRPDAADPLRELALALRRFADERDWEQFHAPKNLAAALSVEAAELLEHFQWMTEDASRELPPETLAQVGEEMADVLLYLVRLADKLDVDLVQAARRKMQLNAQKYPVERARGSSRKYTQI
jgi:NTP pyrophosphatase (non-canonical NTP hydrolase)